MNNRRSRGWVKDLVLLSMALLLMVGLGLGFAELVERGQPRRESFTRDIERAFADAVEASVRASSDVRDDPVVQDLVATMQARLEAGLPTLVDIEVALPEIRILVVDSAIANAVAFPGNLVVLYSGLVLELDGPEALAGVLAHEIGHCVSNDARKALIREVGLSVLLGSAGSGSAGELAGEAVRGAVRMKYGRRAEERADQFAVELLAASEIDPRAYSRALGTLADVAGEVPEWARYVDVHPPIQERIDDAIRRAEGKGPVEYVSLPVDWAAVLAALDPLSP